MVRRTRARRMRPGQKGELSKIFGAIVLGIVAVGGIVAMFALSSTAPKAKLRDPNTLCPATGSDAVHVVLLDATDDLPVQARTEITRLLTDMVTQTPKDGLIEIRLLDPQQRGGRTIFSKCNPGDGSDLSEWTANPALARRRWVESFQKPLQTALETGLRPSKADVSPILSTLQMIAIERFSGPAIQAIPKRLTVLSDMIEHGQSYSQYSSTLSYEAFRRLDIYRDIRTDLNGSEVTFYQIQRRTRRPIPSADLIKFWIEWTRDNGGRFREALKLQGLG